VFASGCEELMARNSGARLGCSRASIDSYLLLLREVYQQAAIACRQPSHTMASGTYSDRQVAPARELDSPYNVFSRCASRNNRGGLIKSTVPDLSGRVVV
jgi:hypothetical protein